MELWYRHGNYKGYFAGNSLIIGRVGDRGVDKISDAPDRRLMAPNAPAELFHRCLMSEDREGSNRRSKQIQMR